MIGVAATVLPYSTRNGFSAKVIALLLLSVGAIVSFVSAVLLVTIVLAFALITCVVVDSIVTMPKPTAAYIADNNSNEIASGFFLILFSIRHIVSSRRYTLDLFNETVKYQRMR